MKIFGTLQKVVWSIVRYLLTTRVHNELRTVKIHDIKNFSSEKHLLAQAANF